MDKSRIWTLERINETDKPLTRMNKKTNKLPISGMRKMTTDVEIRRLTRESTTLCPLF